MKTHKHSGVDLIRHRAGLLSLIVAAVFAVFTPVLHAQCAGGGDPDALGCSSLSDSLSNAKESPASVNINESTAPQTPKADNSTEASAVESLQKGTNHTESGLAATTRQHGSSLSQGDALTDFQRFVAASTGQTLPVYGTDLFFAMPASFGPLDHGPAPGELIIGTNDELRVRIWGQVNFSANLRVSREGNIYLPKVGNVHVAGLPFSDVSGHLRSAMEPIYRNFQINVDMGDIHSIQIYVSGFAHRPGEYTVSALSTLVDAIFATGGPSPAGSMRHVRLKRANKVVADFDLYALLVHGDKSGDMQLQPGDIIYFPSTGPQAALLGSVRQAGIYELRGPEPIQNLIDAAGGTTTIAADGLLSLERIENHAQRRAFEFPADSKGLATLLADGDIVRVDPIVSKYRETVTLRGAVANPGRFRWHEGLRLSELMPDRDSLMKRDYWWRRTQLGLPAPQLAPVASSDNRAEKPAAVESPSAQTNWNYAVIERLDPATMTTSLIPFGLGKLVLDHDMSQNLVLMPGDVITIFSQSDIQIPINEQTKYVRLEGEFVHPGIYSIAPGETLRTVVQQAGGTTSQAYLYGAFFARKSTLALEKVRLNEFADQLEQQLARSSMKAVGVVNSTTSQQAIAINREMIERIRRVQASGRIVLDTHPNSRGDYEFPDMHLEDGDRLLVPFTPETVQVIGAVFNPHSFLYHDGATVGEYLRLAGGPTRDADKKRLFVLRADGSVISHDSVSGAFSEGFAKLRLHPGDSIVMPEKDVHPSANSYALAWAQALSGAIATPLAITALTK